MLRVKDDEGRWQRRSPAMAAGLADHVWSIPEWHAFPQCNAGKPRGKFKGELNMPFTRGQSDNSSQLCATAYGWGKIASRRAFGEQGPGLDLDYESIESMADEVGQAVIKGSIEEVLKDQLQLLDEQQLCPK